MSKFHSIVSVKVNLCKGGTTPKIWPHIVSVCFDSATIYTLNHFLSIQYPWAALRKPYLLSFSSLFGMEKNKTKKKTKTKIQLGKKQNKGMDVQFLRCFFVSLVSHSWWKTNKMRTMWGAEYEKSRASDSEVIYPESLWHRLGLWHRVL